MKTTQCADANNTCKSLGPWPLYPKKPSLQCTARTISLFQNAEANLGFRWRELFDVDILCSNVLDMASGGEMQMKEDSGGTPECV